MRDRVSSNSPLHAYSFFFIDIDGGADVLVRWKRVHCHHFAIGENLNPRMFGSAVVYVGVMVVLVGVVVVLRPLHSFWALRRGRGALLATAGVVLVATGLSAPARESRSAEVRTRLDEVAPVWQFREFHSRRIAAPPARVFEAVGRVTADEIALFRTLTWIRRGGRALPESILNARPDESLIDLATRTTFVRLADEAPRELVVGTVVIAPAGTRGTLTPEVFRRALPPGFAVAAMNFLVTPDGAGGSLVSTETRVYASSPDVRRRFAAYWRIIYPGSALIRRMWLRAIARRAIRA